MAFGLLCGKWRILKKPLLVKLANAGLIFLCCARLHNFVINERLQRYGIIPDPPDPRIRRNARVNDDFYYYYAHSDRTIVEIPGYSYMRNILVDRLSNLGIL
jgi:hypothetical protein